jgi:hypothetical protein
MTRNTLTTNLVLRSDIPRHAIDTTVREFSAHNLLLVRKGLTSRGAGAAGSEEAKQKAFLTKVERGAVVRQVRLLTSPFILWTLT